MKLKSAIKYQVISSIKPVIIFYIVIYALFIFFSVSTLTFSRHGVKTNIGGMEFSTMVFLFVCGLNSFKTHFHLLLVNGVSRKTVFNSFMLGILPVAGGMALIDSINRLIVSIFAPYNTTYAQLYQARYAAMQPTFGTNLQIMLEGFLWMAFMYAMVAMVGYFITTLYYRMNKPAKLAVSIGVPVLVMVVMPYIDGLLLRGTLFKSIASFIARLWGFYDGANPYIAILSCTVIFALFGLFSYLLIRKATIKE